MLVMSASILLSVHGRHEMSIKYTPDANDLRNQLHCQDARRYFLNVER